MCAPQERSRENGKPGMVAYILNSVHRRQRQKYLCKFEDSQGYTGRPHLKEKKEIKERRKEQAKHGGSATNPSTQNSGRLQILEQDL